MPEEPAPAERDDSQEGEHDPQDRPDRPRAGLVDALRVRRNAAIGFGLGVLLAAALLFGAVTGPGGRYPGVYYVGLGFVLAVGVGLLVTAALTIGTVYRLSRSL